MGHARRVHIHTTRCRYYGGKDPCPAGSTRRVRGAHKPQAQAGTQHAASNPACAQCPWRTPDNQYPVCTLRVMQSLDTHANDVSCHSCSAERSGSEATRWRWRMSWHGHSEWPNVTSAWVAPLQRIQAAAAAIPRGAPARGSLHGGTCPVGSSSGGRAAAIPG